MAHSTLGATEDDMRDLEKARSQTAEDSGEKCLNSGGMQSQAMEDDTRDLEQAGSQTAEVGGDSGGMQSHSSIEDKDSKKGEMQSLQDQAAPPNHPDHTEQVGPNVQSSSKVIPRVDFSEVACAVDDTMTLIINDANEVIVSTLNPNVEEFIPRSPRSSINLHTFDNILATGTADCDTHTSQRFETINIGEVDSNRDQLDAEQETKDEAKGNASADPPMSLLLPCIPLQPSRRERNTMLQEMIPDYSPVRIGEYNEYEEDQRRQIAVSVKKVTEWLYNNSRMTDAMPEEPVRYIDEIYYQVNRYDLHQLSGDVGDNTIQETFEAMDNPTSNAEEIEENADGDVLVGAVGGEINDTGLLDDTKSGPSQPQEDTLNKEPEN